MSVVVDQFERMLVVFFIYLILLHCLLVVAVLSSLFKHSVLQLMLSKPVLGTKKNLPALAVKPGCTIFVLANSHLYENRSIPDDDNG